MKASIKIFILTLSTLIAACGPSKTELARLQLLDDQRARAAAELAQQAAQKNQRRVATRLLDAKQHWLVEDDLSEEQIQGLFRSQDRRFAGLSQASLQGQQSYFMRYPLQASRYRYKQGTHPLSIVGIRSLANSGPYSELFPNASARYSPGHSANSVLEFVLQQDLEKNRLGQDVLMTKGHRWVAAVANFKQDDSLKSLDRQWHWIDDVFEDINWQAPPEVTHPQTDSRALEIQLGLRFCTLTDRCYSNIDYRGHPTHAVRAEVISILIGNRKSGEILARFVRQEK